MKELGGKTDKDIIFYDEGSKWRALVQRCEHLTREDETKRAAIADGERENYWRKHVVPNQVPGPDMDEDALSKAMQAEIDKGRTGR